MHNKEYFYETFEMFERAYGMGSEINMCIEEMSELIKALCKYNRQKNYAEKTGLTDDAESLKIKNNIIEECADVLICASQIARLFGDGEVRQIMEQKIERGRKIVESDLDLIDRNNGGSEK